MSAFATLADFWQTIIPLFLFSEAALEWGLLLYRLIRRAKIMPCLCCAVNFVILFILMFAATKGDPNQGKDAFLLMAPWGIFVLAIILGGGHFAIAFRREYWRHKNELSPFSIKEATDNLPLGICFVDPNGRVILCNDRMRRLSFALSGHELQIVRDLTEALAKPAPDVTVLNDCYILPDKSIWQFRFQEITVDGDNRWRQVTAHDITEFYNANLRQAEINRELRAVNGKLHKMYERMADDIKEKERLDLKIYIHDTIGRSLLTIRDIIDNGADTEQKIKALREAVSVLATNRTLTATTLDEVRATAEALGVKIEIDGYLPPDSLVEELAAAALRECVTNCIKHAGGNEVYIRIAQRGEHYDVTITNNGKIPTKPIKEGSGLSTLRRSIERSGGEMHISHNPRFALLITIPAKEISL